jgi:hypothetical protein
MRKQLPSLIAITLALGRSSELGLSRKFEMCRADGSCQVLTMTRSATRPYRLAGELEYVETKAGGQKIISKRTPIIESNVSDAGVPTTITFPSHKLGEPNKSFGLFFSGDNLELIGPSCNPKCVMHPITGIVSNCLDYQPNQVVLRGKLARQVFPGRPNFADVRKGDEPEDSLILHLTKPICVNDNTSVDMTADAESNVQEVQLVVANSDDWKKVAALAGSEIAVSGSLFHRVTGHHHTAVLITVTNLH